MDIPTRRQTLIVGAYWAACAVAFWFLQDDVSWNTVFPLLGGAWMAGPLVLTRHRASSVLIVSSVTLTILVTAYLALVWAAVSILGFIGSVVFELETSPSPMRLIVDGVKTLPGALAGVALGLVVRSRSIDLPVE